MNKQIKITCLVNDSVNMDSGCWGEHGLSFLIETPHNNILFDAGSSPEILAHNLKTLKIKLDTVSYLVLSHGHYDHTGALEWLLGEMKSPSVIADPGTFDLKYYQSQGDKKLHSIGSPLSRKQIELKAKLHVTVEPYTIAEGIYLTGWIPRVTDFENVPKHFVTEQEGELVPDNFLDDRSLVLDTDKGLILVCGCCHAGIINTILHVRKIYAKPVYSVVGGIHLFGATEERISKTLGRIRDTFNIHSYYFNHCTGDEAYAAFKCELGTRVKPFLAGDHLEF
jgi:7,8-dihydropterin-6-yl-methyl-4-(beta-D-ribofuranosyl)aminobenzene 5'-phosphate synthase